MTLCVSGSLAGASPGVSRTLGSHVSSRAAISLLVPSGDRAPPLRCSPPWCAANERARRRSNTSSPWLARLAPQAGVPVTHWSHGTPSPNSHHERDCTIHLCRPSRAFFKRQPLYSHTAVAIGNIPTLMIGTPLPRKARGNLYAACHCHRAVCNIRPQCGKRR